MSTVAKSSERIGRELGIPEGEPVECMTMDASKINPDWAGYSLEFVGVPAPTPPNDLAFIYAESGGVGIRVWRIRIRREGVQAYLEARTPGGRTFDSVDLRNLDPLNRGDNADMLTTGVAILYPRVFRTRPPGTGRFVNAEEFHQAYRDALVALKRENIKPSRPILAYRLGISVRTYDKYKNMYSRPE